jgi:hypothetical protein
MPQKRTRRVLRGQVSDRLTLILSVRSTLSSLLFCLKLDLMIFSVFECDEEFELVRLTSDEASMWSVNLLVTCITGL